MLLELVEAEASARPDVPSAIQAVEATDQPDGRELSLEVRSAERELSAAVETKRLRALGPPQVALAPLHCMLHDVDGRESEAPLERTLPQ